MLESEARVLSLFTFHRKPAPPFLVVFQSSKQSNQGKGMSCRARACGSADGAGVLAPGASGFLELVFCTAAGGRLWTHAFADIPATTCNTFAAATAPTDCMWAGAVDGALVVIACVQDDGTGCGRGAAMTKRIVPLLETRGRPGSPVLQPVRCAHVNAVHGFGGMVVFTSDAGIVYLYNLFGELGDPRRLRALGTVDLVRSKRALACFVSESAVLFSLASGTHPADGPGRLATCDELLAAAAGGGQLPDLAPPGWASDCIGEMIRDGNATILTLISVGERAAACSRRTETSHNMFGAMQPPRVRNSRTAICARLRSPAVVASRKPCGSVLCLCKDGRVVSILDSAAGASAVQTVSLGARALTSTGFAVKEDQVPVITSEAPAAAAAATSVHLTATPLGFSLADFGLSDDDEENGEELRRPLMYVDLASPEQQARHDLTMDLDAFLMESLDRP